MTSNTVNEVFLLSKIFGCFPFHLKEGEFIVDYRLLAYSFILKLVFTPQPVINIFEASFVIFRTRVHLTTSTISFILASIFSYISLFNYFRNRNKLVKIFKRYQVADSKIRNLGERPYLSVALYSDCLLLAVGPCVGCIRYCITPKMTWYMMYQVAYLINVMISTYMLVHPFVRLVENLTTRMKRLSIIMRHLCESVPSHAKTYHLGSVIDLYDLLCSTSDALNEIFSYNLLFFVFVVFFMITTYGYYTITSAVKNYAVTLISGVAAIFYGIVMCLIAVHSERLTKEATEFNNLLFQMMIKDKNGDIQNNKKLRLHILMKRKLGLTVCGLFPLDHALIHSMIAAATTYLVILEEIGN